MIEPRMIPSMGAIGVAGDACLGGCGKRVNNVWGRCRECRTRSCSKCGVKYAPDSKSKGDRCGRCRPLKS